jgi:hypothetical protein
MELYGCIHFILYAIYASYGLLFQKNWFDVWYVILSFMMAISWTIFKGECILSLLLKWQKDPSYEMGTDSNAHDIREFLGEEYIPWMKRICFFLLFLRAYSIYLVMTRLNINYSIYFSYFYLLYTLTNKYISFLLYQLFFFFIFFYGIIVTIY